MAVLQFIYLQLHRLGQLSLGKLVVLFCRTSQTNFALVIVFVYTQHKTFLQYKSGL